MNFLAETGPDYGFEKENKTLLTGKWRRHEKMPPEALIPYAKRHSMVLHTAEVCPIKGAEGETGSGTAFLN